MLGNGIALFTIAQASFAGQLQQDTWLFVACERFIAGLAIAFLAMTISYFLALAGMYTIAKLSIQFLVLADADRQSISEASDDLRHAQASAIGEIGKAPGVAARMQCLTALNVAFYGISGVLSVWGLSACLRLTIVPAP